MRKLVCALLAALIAALCVAAAAEDDWYVAQGTMLVKRMHALAADEGYREVYSVQNDAAKEFVDKIADADLDRPMSARALFIPERDELLDLFTRASALLAGEENFALLAKLSGEAKDELAKKLPTTLASLLNNRLGGTSWIMVSAILGTSEGFVEPHGFSPCVLLLEYPGEYEFVVAFQRIGEGVVNATANPVPAGSAALVDEYVARLAKYVASPELRELPVE